MYEITVQSNEQKGEMLVNLGSYVWDLGFAGVFLRQLIFP